MVQLTFLDPVYARPGPYACAYLDTSRDIPDPEAAISLRRRHLREDLAGQGADDATVAAVADVAGSDREIAGRHGQAFFASQGHLALVEEAPDPPAHDAAWFSALPDVMPLAVQQRCHHWSGPAAEWPYGATEVADELAELVRRSGAEVIVLGGEVWARNVLVNRLPAPLRERVVTVAEDGHVAGEGRALLEQELSDVFRRTVAQHACRAPHAAVGGLGADPDRYVGRRPGVLRCPRLPGGTARCGLDPCPGRHRRGVGGRGAGGTVPGGRVGVLLRYIDPGVLR